MCLGKRAYELRRCSSYLTSTKTRFEKWAYLNLKCVVRHIARHMLLRSLRVDTYMHALSLNNRASYWILQATNLEVPCYKCPEDVGISCFGGFNFTLSSGWWMAPDAQQCLSGSCIVERVYECHIAEACTTSYISRVAIDRVTIAHLDLCAEGYRSDVVMCARCVLAIQAYSGSHLDPRCTLERRDGVKEWLGFRLCFVVHYFKVSQFHFLNVWGCGFQGYTYAFGCWSLHIHIQIKLQSGIK